MKVAIFGLEPHSRSASGWDEHWCTAHDHDAYRMDRAVEAHAPDWFWPKWKQEDRRDRLEILAEKCLYTPWKWLERLGPKHEVIPYDLLPARCITSSLAYMMGLAIHFNATKIGLFGISLDAGEEYTHQRAGLHYLIGRADERGIEVTVHPNSGLLDKEPYGAPGTQPERFRERQ